MDDLFSLKGLVSLAVTIPLAIGALFQLRIRSAHVNIRRDSPVVSGIGHTVVAGGARGATIIGGLGHAVSITQQRFEAALRPGEAIALGFWGWVCLIGLCLTVLFVPYIADIAVVAEFLACFILPALALVAVFDLKKSGEHVGGAMTYFIFTGLISWIVLQSFDGLRFLPEYAPSFRPLFDTLFLRGQPIWSDFLKALIIASSAFGFAMLLVAHTKIGLAYLVEDRGITYAVQFGLLSLIGVFSAVVLASGLGLAVWNRSAPQFVWAIFAQIFPVI